MAGQPPGHTGSRCAQIWRSRSICPPELASAGWRPLFFDYLYLGLTSALAFSSTNTMPLARWAKTAIGAQSIISIAVVGLVIARAVNIFA